MKAVGRFQEVFWNSQVFGVVQVARFRNSGTQQLLREKLCGAK